MYIEIVIQMCHRNRTNEKLLAKIDAKSQENNRYNNKLIMIVEKWKELQKKIYIYLYLPIFKG